MYLTYSLFLCSPFVLSNMLEICPRRAFVKLMIKIDSSIWNSSNKYFTLEMQCNDLVIFPRFSFSKLCPLPYCDQLMGFWMFIKVIYVDNNFKGWIQSAGITPDPKYHIHILHRCWLTWVSFSRLRFDDRHLTENDWDWWDYCGCWHRLNGPNILLNIWSINV